MSIKPLSNNILELIKDEFDINPSFAEKDWYSQHILGVIANFPSDEFQPIFSGGTSLSKGYQLIQRFSEDIDFRVRPLKEQLSRGIRRGACHFCDKYLYLCCFPKLTNQSI